MLKPYTTLDIIIITLALIHFGAPLTYYWYMKTKYLNKPWNIKINPNYNPKITIIVPTYNEAKLIWKKLDNLAEQTYPKNLTEIIVIDSASTDRTPEIVKKWIDKHSNINIKLIQEHQRKGKAHALNHALQYTTGEIVIITDADCWWPKNALQEAVKWFADLTVGAVSCLKTPINTGPVSVEEDYRRYYNVLRVAESKAWATPIFHGELAAFRKELLKKLNGFPTDVGADDSHVATKIILMGYRAITSENLWCSEVIPSKNYFQWRVRRAQHLVQHFIKTLKCKPKAIREFKTILYTETYLHLVNPWLLIIAILLITLSITKSVLTIILLALGIMLLMYRPYRTWMHQQLALIVAQIRNIVTRELVWIKQPKQ